MTPRASILAVGTEVVSGQIINRNAAWISARLADFGIETVMHETVPDERGLIARALERCASESELVIVTGGLGPTSDDFTRELIAEWAGLELEFDDATWKQLLERLQARKVAVVESQKQQCYFPRGSRILFNSAGTANAFSLSRGSTRLWALPGPPKEIEAVWNAHLEPELISLAPERSSLKLMTWDCLGVPEARLGEIVDATLMGSGLKTGFRLKQAYIEVKVWVPSEHPSHDWIAKLEAAISPWMITKGGEDICDAWVTELLRFDEIEIIDSATGGMLGERLGAKLRDPKRRELGASISQVNEWASPSNLEDWMGEVLRQADPETLTLAVAGIDSELRWAVGIASHPGSKSELLSVPYPVASFQERNQRAIVELALARWARWLKERVH